MASWQSEKWVRHAVTESLTLTGGGHQLHKDLIQDLILQQTQKWPEEPLTQLLIRELPVRLSMAAGASAGTATTDLCNRVRVCICLCMTVGVYISVCI